ncbi:protein L [Pseudomonas sp. R3-56]
MARVIEETVQYLKKTPKTVLGGAVWDTLYQISSTVPVSGIYRCEGCGDEITSNKDDRFPPQNKHQHTNTKKVEWRLIVETQTKG